MNIIFINRISSKSLPFFENVYFYSAYLIADKSYYYSNFSFLNSYFEIKINEQTEEFILALYMQTCSEKDMGNFKENTLDLFKRCKQNKKIKHKSKDNILDYNRKNFILKTMLSSVTTHAEIMLYSFGFKMDQIKLIDNNTIKIIEGHADYNEEIFYDEEDNMIDLISTNIVNNQKIFLLDDYIEELFKPIDLKLYSGERIKTDEFISIPLFILPYFRYFDANNLISSRNALINNMNQLSDLILNLQNSVKNRSLDNDSVNIVKNSLTSFTDLSETILSQMINLLYFQKEINSGLLKLDLQVCLGISRVAAIPEYYYKNETIKSFVSDTIKKNTELKVNLNSCQVFLYIKPINQTISEYIIQFNKTLKC